MTDAALVVTAPARPEGASPPGGPETVIGRNGVPAAQPRPASAGEGYRSYEIHQRLRVRQSTEKLDPARLVSPAFARDPYPTLELLREDYPCFRDWVGNSYWISRYDDVTSVFVDEANFESRSKLSAYGAEGYGRDLRGQLPVQACLTERMDAAARPVADALIDALPAGGADLATEFAALYPLRLLADALGLPPEALDDFADLHWRMQRGRGWDPAAEAAGLAAMDALAGLFEPLLAARRRTPGPDLLSLIAGLPLAEGPASARDVVVTLLEGDDETLHGGLANLLCRLLTHPEQLALVAADRRLVKSAWLETLRHSAPVLTAARHARHEVERFGLLLPEGALVVCAAAAANRDPRVFDDPDRFDILRRDLCQREPRGQYRADGLASGIAFGLGPPSRHPAVPRDRPRSLYALTRDLAVTAVGAVLDRLADLRLEPGADPVLRSLSVSEMHTCWSLPVRYTKR